MQQEPIKGFSPKVAQGAVDLLEWNIDKNGLLLHPLEMEEQAQHIFNVVATLVQTIQTLYAGIDTSDLGVKNIGEESTNKALKEIGNIVGGPTMTYSPKTEVDKWRARAEKISRIISSTITKVQSDYLSHKDNLPNDSPASR